MTYRLALKEDGKIRIRQSKDYSCAINALMMKRAQILYQPNASQDIDVIDKALALLGFHEDPQKYMRCRENRRLFEKGELRQITLEVVSNAPTPITSREIAIIILDQRGHCISDKDFLYQITSQVGKIMRRHEACENVKSGGHPIKWRKPY